MKKLTHTKELSSNRLRAVSKLLRGALKSSLLLGLMGISLQTASAATFNVTNGADSGAGSLRQAIIDANATPNSPSTTPDTITFSGALSITPTSALPIITEAVTIDGYSAPNAVRNTAALGAGFNGTLVVELNGSMAGDSVIGLQISASNCTVQGLAINRFQSAGILINAGTASKIYGNFIGTDINGTAALGNFDRGVLIVGSTLNQIGTAAPGNANVISGNSGTGISITGGGSALIRRNFIGTDKSGTADLGNFQDGVRIVDSSGSTVGGTDSGSRNVISGNDANGVAVIQSAMSTMANSNLVQANFIGVDVTGNASTAVGGFQTSAVGNSGSGVLINAAGNTVGGNRTTSGTSSNCVSQCNVISGNRANGVSVSSGFASANVVTGNNIGVGLDNTTVIGNRDNGVQISNLAAGNAIGGTASAARFCNNTCNIVANNGSVEANSARAGVYVDITGGAGNRIRGNSIFMNAGIGIDLDTVGANANDALDPDTGANNRQNSPVLNSANTSGAVGGTLNSTPNTTFAIDFFSNTAADSNTSEARTFIGSTAVTTNASGNALISFTAGATALTAGQFVTATATATGGSAQTIGDSSEISNAQAVIPSTTGGAAGLEADVADRPNGDGTVQSNDVVQIRRFLNTADTFDSSANEFQRADVAPFDTRGDGFIRSNDVVIARSYQNGTNPPQAAAGPTAQASPSPTPPIAEGRISSKGKSKAVAGNASENQLESNAGNAPENHQRQLRIESTSGRTEQQVTVNVRVDAIGDESEYAFQVNFNQSVLSNPVVGAGNTGAVTRSCQVNAGRVNCSVGTFPNNSPSSGNTGIGEIAAGDNQILVSITFTVAANAPTGATPVTLSNFDASNDIGTNLAITSANGTVTIAQARQLRVESTSSSAGRTATVNIRVDAVGDESNYGFILNYNTSVLSNPVVGAGNAGAAIRDCQAVTMPGQLNCAIEGFPNNAAGSNDPGTTEIMAGDNQILITVTFNVAANAQSGSTPLTFSNVNASNDRAQLVAITSTNGTVTINAPTAATVSVSGRVTAGRRGISRARVSITDASGATRFAVTNSLGNYRFTDVPAGETYTFNVQAKRYRFDTQVLNLSEDSNSINFTAAP